MDWDDITRMLPSLEELGALLAQLLPRIVIALVVMFVGWLVALGLSAAVRRVLSRLGDRLRSDAARTAWTEMHGRGTGDLVSRGVFWITILAAVMIATEALGLRILSTWLGLVTAYLPRIIVAFVVMFGGIAGGRLLEGGVSQAAARIAPRQARQLGRFIRVSIIVVATLVAASQLGLDVSLITAVFLIVLGTMLAGAALAFGLGARGVIANILGMHYVQHSYRVGERIRIGDDEGRIVRTSATAVFVEGLDGEVAIPGRAFSEGRCLRIGEQIDVTRS